MWNSFYGRFDESFFGDYLSCLTSFLRLCPVINGSQDQADKYFVDEFKKFFKIFHSTILENEQSDQWSRMVDKVLDFKTVKHVSDSTSQAFIQLH